MWSNDSWQQMLADQPKCDWFWKLQKHQSTVVEGNKGLTLLLK